MKNLLYLFLAVIMFSCSDDDSSDTNDNNSNQTFLERYDGVVWQRQMDDEFEDATGLLAFYNNPEMFRRNSGASGNCEELYFGIFNDEIGEGWNLLLNDGDTLSAELVTDEGIAVGISTGVVVDDVLTETITYPEDESYINEVIYTRTTLTDPCN